MTPNKRRAMFEAFARANPHPQGELRYTSPFELLIAVVLSAQATDRSVNAATEVLFAKANTPAAIETLGESGLAKYIHTIGLFRSKARHIIALCRQLRERHGGAVPRTREELESLAGVGRKSASVVLNIAYGQPCIAVDTHCFRVANRTGLAPGKNVREVERQLALVVPEKYRHDAHHWLILHGRYVCKARKPECWRCVISRQCEYEPKTPAPKAR